METNKKYAVLSMDVEDWHQLYYFLGKADSSYSMLDGFTNYVELLNRHNIKTTFFVLSDIAESIKDQLKYAISCGHEIACHGKHHTRPLDLSPDEFRNEITEAKTVLEDITGREIIGYRAPCYGIDDLRYQIVQETGFKYSSSKMDITGHPLYGELDLSSFDQPVQGIYTKGDITEFALSTQKLMGKSVAVSGGGWIRLLPWNMLMKPLIKKYLKAADTYTLYIHPFELSSKPMPKVPGSNILSSIRARKGLGKVDAKIEQLIGMLEENQFEFATFANVRNALLNAEDSSTVISQQA